jgi:hypothetical protein
MPKIVKLGALLPEDIAFEMPGGQRFVAPGDPPLDLILKIASLFERAEEEGNEGIGIEVLRELDEEVVRLLQMRDPDLTASPFGVIGVQHFVATLLGQYGFGEAEDEEPADPPKRAKRSKPSSGSQSLSTSSTSRPTTGEK